MKKSLKAAVITGDIIQSSVLSNTEKRKMLKALQGTVAQGVKLMPDFEMEIFQGDSLQGMAKMQMGQSLRYALIIITSLLKQNLKIRIAIGIGNITFSSEKITTSNGPAFQFSGRLLDEMKKKSGSFIGIGTEQEDINNEFEVYGITMDYLLARCTTLQAEALQLGLEDLTQVQMAKKLKISQPTVQQRLQAAGWPVFKAVLQRFESKY